MLGLVDVYQKSKGSVVTALKDKAATSTSEKIDCTGYNSVLVQVILNATKNWTIKIQGSLTENGTYADCYELANTGEMALMSHQTNASSVFCFKGIPDWIKVVATEDEDGAKITVHVQPFNA